jgi:selenocysteine-specific elongation factor
LAGLPVSHLSSRAGIPWQECQAFVTRMTQGGQVLEIGGSLVAASHVSAAQEAVIAVLTRYHSNHPLEDGMPREEVRERVFSSASPQVFDRVLHVLSERELIVARERVALAAHNVALTDDEARAREALIDILRAGALAPPDLSTLAARIALPLDVVNRIATLLVRRSVLVRAGDLLFHESVLEQLKAEIQSMKQRGERDTLDVGSFKDRFHVTRKYAIPLLEYLDRERVTRRVGDTRKIL